MDPAPTPGDGTSAGATPGSAGTMAADIAEGLRFLFGQPLIRSLTLLGLGNSFTGGAVTALLVVLVVDALALPADGPWYGVLLAAVALGGLLAALALPRLGQRRPIGTITLAGLAACPVAVLAVAVAPGPGWMLAPLVLWSLASTLVILHGITARQRLTPRGCRAGSTRRPEWSPGVAHRSAPSPAARSPRSSTYAWRSSSPRPPSPAVPWRAGGHPYAPGPSLDRLPERGAT
jgi:hypothetical protein